MMGVLTTINMQAQDDWKGIANFDPAIIPTVKGGVANFQFGVLAQKEVYPYLALGFGAGIEENWKFKSGWAFPIFVNAHMEQFDASLSPTFDFRMGYSFSTQTFDYSSFFINPTIGVRYEQLGIGIGYLGGVANVEGAPWTSNINIRLSYYFGYHKTDFFTHVGHGLTALWNELRKINFGVDLTLDAGTGGSDEEDVKLSTGCGVNFSFLYPINEYLEIGPMAGFHYQPMKYQVDYPSPDGNYYKVWQSGNDHFWFPIALRTRYNARQATFCGRFYPWVRLDLGGYITRNSDMGKDYCDLKDGFYWSPAVGVSMDLKDGNHSLDFSVGYTSIKTYTIFDMNYKHPEDVDPVRKGICQISLGYKF